MSQFKISLGAEYRRLQNHDAVIEHRTTLRPVYYYVFAVFTTFFYSKLRPTVEPDYSTLNKHLFFKIRLYRKGHTVIDHSERHNF